MSLLPVRIHMCENDLPSGITFASGMMAIDTETTGLSLTHDKLCLIQIGNGEGDAWLVKLAPPHAPDTPALAAPNLRHHLENPRLTKLFHFARFDVAMLQKHLHMADLGPLFCTKIASKLVRPHEGKHNLRTLVKHYLGAELDKTEQMSDWSAPVLSASQQAYAASDVIHLHALTQRLSAELADKNLTHMMHQALQFLPTRVEMDLRGYPLDAPSADLFAHH